MKPSGRGGAGVCVCGGGATSVCAAESLDDPTKNLIPPAQGTISTELKGCETGGINELPEGGGCCVCNKPIKAETVLCRYQSSKTSTNHIVLVCARSDGQKPDVFPLLSAGVIEI